MSRVIKFRAWNDIDNSYIDWMTLCGMPRLITNTARGREKHYYLEQFTGLLDKNGVEIYEGDIVYCVTNDPFGTPEQEATFVVEFDYGSFLAMTASEEQFVIGNIHQNPELIKQRVMK